MNLGKYMYLIHVNADCATGCSDFLGGEKDIKTGATAKINDSLPLQPSVS